jgi:hypothetical protein
VNAAGEESKSPALERRVREMSDGAGLNIIARLPEEQDSTPPPTSGKSVGEALRTLNTKAPHLQAKWRGGILLATYPTWFWDEDSKVPRAFANRLREALEKQDGVLQAEDLVEAARVMTRGQLKVLGKEMNALNHVEALYEPFALLHLNPTAARHVRSEQGLPFDARLRDLLVSNVHMRLALEQFTPTAIRFRREESEIRGMKSILMVFELRNPEGKWLAPYGFHQPLRSTGPPPATRP